MTFALQHQKPGSEGFLQCHQPRRDPALGLPFRYLFVEYAPFYQIERALSRTLFRYKEFGIEMSC